MTIEREVRHRIAAIAQQTLGPPDPLAKDPQARHTEILLTAARKIVEGCDPGQRLLEALRSVVAAERLVRLAFELKAQQQLGVSAILEFARAAARETYQLGMRAARTLGVAAPDGGRWPDPAVFFEPMATPVTYVRGRRARVLGLVDGGMQDLPFPVVLVPWYPAAALGSLSVLHHEIGHNLDEDLGISNALEPIFDARLGLPTQRVDQWVQWTREVVADTFAFLYAGAAFLRELEAWARVLDHADELPSASHPYPWVRVAIGCEQLAMLGVDHGRSPPSQGDPEQARLLDEARAVARVVLESPLPALAGASLRDLAPQVADEHRRLRDLAPQVCAKPKKLPPVLASVPLRLMPSLARFAADEPGADPQAITDALFAHVAARRVATSTPFREEIYARTTLRAQVAPILDEEEGGLKRPPPDLFRRSQRLSFVGATNDSLPDLFDAHLAAGGAKKEHIDIFFLAVPQLDRLAHPACDVDKLRKLREAAITALDDTRMGDIARSWRILVHDEPYYFAAYFDADRPGGRIHVSSHGWGQDLKRAPAADHTWPRNATAPARTYAWYLAALGSLAARATVVRESPQT